MAWYRLKYCRPQQTYSCLECCSLNIKKAPKQLRRASWHPINPSPGIQTPLPQQRLVRQEYGSCCAIVSIRSTHPTNSEIHNVFDARLDAGHTALKAIPMSIRVLYNSSTMDALDIEFGNILLNVTAGPPACKASKLRTALLDARVCLSPCRWRALDHKRTSHRTSTNRTLHVLQTTTTINTTVQQ